MAKHPDVAIGARLEWPGGDCHVMRRPSHDSSLLLNYLQYDAAHLHANRLQQPRSDLACHAANTKTLPAVPNITYTYITIHEIAINTQRSSSPDYASHHI